jgi:hypothetical protein
MTIGGNRVAGAKIVTLQGRGRIEIFIGLQRGVLIRYLQFDYDLLAQLNGAQIAVLDFEIGVVSTQSRERTSTHRPKTHRGFRQGAACRGLLDRGHL